MPIRDDNNNFAKRGRSAEIAWRALRRRSDPGPTRLSGRRAHGQEHQTELAHLDLVTVGQHRGVDQFTVDIGAVEAVDVDDLEFGCRSIRNPQKSDVPTLTPLSAG